jgi:hypothetical protein
MPVITAIQEEPKVKTMPGKGSKTLSKIKTKGLGCSLNNRALA